jgi:hypothetical protein
MEWRVADIYVYNLAAMYLCITVFVCIALSLAMIGCGKETGCGKILELILLGLGICFVVIDLVLQLNAIILSENVRGVADRIQNLDCFNPGEASDERDTLVEIVSSLGSVILMRVFKISFASVGLFRHVFMIRKLLEKLSSDDFNQVMPVSATNPHTASDVVEKEAQGAAMVGDLFDALLAVIVFAVFTADAKSDSDSFFTNAKATNLGCTRRSWGTNLWLQIHRVSVTLLRQRSALRLFGYA